MQAATPTFLAVLLSRNNQVITMLHLYGQNILRMTDLIMKLWERHTEKSPNSSYKRVKYRNSATTS